MSIHFIDQGTPEWDYAWDQLATADINLGQADPIACEHPECGEIWQYMGTVYENVQGIPATAWHQFRHRMHPKTRQREIRSVLARPGWGASVKKTG